MYLFFDTETTGLPKNWKAPITDLENWPRLVQLAWLVYDNIGNKISTKNFIVKPSGFIISEESTKIHGITHELALKSGFEITEVLNEFIQDVNVANCLVAHNMSFDEKIIGAEFLRFKMDNNIASKKKLCTMMNSTNFCKISGPYGNKWPKLSELHFKLFKTDFSEAHNALVDIEITAKCFGN